MSEWRATILPLSAVLPLRARVLRPGRPLAEARFPGDEDGIHMGLIGDGEASAVATLLPQDEAERPSATIMRLRGMAVEPSLQGQGLGSLLLTALLAEARARGAGLIWCNGRVTALAFYERHGFAAEGAAFELPGSGAHFRLRRQL